MTVLQQMKLINLLNYRGQNSTTFTGRPQGLAVRKQLALDELDTDSEAVELVIPRDTTSFNASFYLGLLYPSIKKLGFDAFKDKYHITFEDETPRSIVTQLSEGERQAQNELQGLTGLGWL
jgi:hypothetical protein